jgi:phosphopantothenoylcysteine decarboxylase/phosphopantothenate--cysteine ligase
MRKPVVVAPAMHHSMYEHPLLKENLQRLRSAGIHLIDPVLEEGKAKLPSVERIADFVTSLLTPHDMEGLKVLITAGPTIEPIDPIKRITNPSSGKMGFAFAKIAVNRGAAATVIYGPGTETPSPGMKVIRVQTTEEMKRAFDRELLEQPDIIVSAAAPQDFVVESPSPRKLRHDQEFTLKLKPAPRILDGARERAPRAFIVGFKAEHGVSDEELESAARMKLAEHKLDLVVANDVARPEVGFGTETSEVVLVGQNYTKRLRGSKERIAREVFDLAIKKLGRRGAERMFSREAFRGAP